MKEAAAIYTGTVVHARVMPKRHRLRYSVFTLAIDLDRIEEVARRTRLFSYNRFNLVSLHDRDHHEGRSKLASRARELLTGAGLAAYTDRIVLMCYPRLLGYAFNPISVYYGYDADGQLGGLIYEVNNTFRERTSYVLAAGAASADGAFQQAANKDMSVSPFTANDGHYTFQLRPPEDETLLAIQFRDAEGPVLRTYFAGRKSKLTSTSLLWHALRYPFVTVKVIVAIHYEALRLFLKGVPLIRRRPTEPHKVSVRAPSEIGTG